MTSPLVNSIMWIKKVACCGDYLVVHYKLEVYVTQIHTNSII